MAIGQFDDNFRLEGLGQIYLPIVGAYSRGIFCSGKLHGFGILDNMTTVGCFKEGKFKQGVLISGNSISLFGGELRLQDQSPGFQTMIRYVYNNNNDDAGIKQVKQIFTPNRENPFHTVIGIR